MTLEDLRKNILFHNSIDVWIEYCAENDLSWNDPEGYGRFIRYLIEKNLNLKAFNLCAHEAGETEPGKKEFAEALANLKAADPNYATYTIRLNGGAMEAIRSFGR